MVSAPLLVNWDHHPMWDGEKKHQPKEVTHQHVGSAETDYSFEFHTQGFRVFCCKGQIPKEKLSNLHPPVNSRLGQSFGTTNKNNLKGRIVIKPKEKTAEANRSGLREVPDPFSVRHSRHRPFEAGAEPGESAELGKSRPGAVGARRGRRGKRKRQEFSMVQGILS